MKKSFYSRLFSEKYPRTVKIAKIAFAMIFYPCYLILFLWALGALYFNISSTHKLHLLPSILWVLSFLVSTFFIRPRWKGLCVAISGFLIILIWHISISPSQDRDWKIVHGKIPSAETSGEIVTIENIRDFEFRTPDDYTVSYINQTFNLKNLRGVDLFLNYWGSSLMAHPIVSFDFGDDGHICFSIETRREKNEGFSAIGGIYKMFEIIYVASTERDSVMLRATAKGEDVFLYRTTITGEQAEILFLQYVRRIKELDDKPEFYNAITANCTTSIRRQNSPQMRRPWDCRMLINGQFDKMLYDNGIIAKTAPFEDIKKKSHINERALKAGYSSASDFSKMIRKQ